MDERGQVAIEYLLTVLFAVLLAAVGYLAYRHKAAIAAWIGKVKRV